MSQSVSVYNNLETLSNSGHFKTHPEPDTSTHSLYHNIQPCHYIDEPCDIKMSEKLCLQWNDFQDNIKSAFGNLREDNDFADVTLACEDGQQQGAISCATARPPVAASAGALTLAGSPSIRAFVAKSILSRFTRFWMFHFQPQHTRFCREISFVALLGVSFS